MHPCLRERNYTFNFQLIIFVRVECQKLLVAKVNMLKLLLLVDRSLLPMKNSTYIIFY